MAVCDLAWAQHDSRRFIPLLLVFIAGETLCKSTLREVEGTPEHPVGRDMNLNDFVVLPNKKAISVKLNVR